MQSLIVASAGFILWSMSIILMYYSTFYSNVDHKATTTGYAGYLLSVIIIYGVYRSWIWTGTVKTRSFNIISLLGIGLLHIFLISIFYTGFPEIRQSPFFGGAPLSSLTLFFHIIELSIYPLILVLLSRNVGLTLGRLTLKSWETLDARIRIPAEITVGFFIFSTLLLLVGLLGMYTITGLILVLGIFFLIGVPGLKQSYRDICSKKITVEYSKNGIDPKVELLAFSKEFAFFFFTLVAAVSLINTIRPMPIGWDDLGVYMNYPKIMATTGELLKGGGMYVWQLITGTGFLFGFNASQAFYVNQLGGILATVFIMSILSLAFETKEKKMLLSLPALFAVFYYVMPMTVFQQAKDMKLDPAYLAFSITALGLLFFGWKHIVHKYERLILILIIGIIVGFTFSIKMTSLMLILGVLGWISYYYLSFFGFVGFFFLFLGTFTLLGLWSIMNVAMPTDIDTRIQLSIFLFIFSFLSYIYAWTRKHHDYSISVRDWIVQSLVFLVGVGLACAPWIVKNLSEITTYSDGKVGIMELLSGTRGTPQYTYDKVFTKEEIAEREQNASQAMTASGKSENEDMGRYFGYESGLNNYLKLPANLTFQKNQGGEFTDITYLFLALVPSILLFVAGRREYSMIIAIGSILVFMLIYYFTKTGGDITRFFSSFTLIYEPGNWKSLGYLILIAINLGIAGIIHYATKDTETNSKLRDISIFMAVYAFIFVIAAFGIVWYGIIIYFAFFLIIGYSASRFLSYSKEDAMKEDTMNASLTLAAILFIFIAVYFIRSAFPNAWNNLRGAYYNEYKYNVLSQEESIFAYRTDYLLPIATMNLIDPSKATEGIQEQMTSSVMKNFLSNTKLSDIPLDAIHQFILKYRGSNDGALRKDVKILSDNFYSAILYPKKENENTRGIYRIGTFMTYLINKNRDRYFDDSLVMSFRDYFYDPVPEIAIERMKKMGLGYLLIDLNAATIDRDPRRNLTDRFEKLLLTTNAKNLRLVATDNFCLGLALGERKKGKITTDNEFLDIAGTNYESYRNGTVIGRNQKLGQCHMYIIKMINENRTNEYPGLEEIKQEIISQNAAQNPQKLSEILSRRAGQSWFALFEILDVPVAAETKSPPSLPSGTGGSTATGGSTSTGGSLSSTGAKK